MKKLVLVLATLSCANVFALTLKEQKTYKEWQASLKDPDNSYSKTVKDKCGFEIPVTLEEKLVTPFMAENASAPSYCDSTRSAISGMCGDETSKAAIKKNIKKIECKLGKKDEASFKLSGGTLTFTFGTGVSNLDDKVKDYLENNLK